MSLFDIVVEPQVRRRRVRQPLSKKKRAAALFRVWHGLHELIEEAGRLGDGELVHFLSIAQLLIEDKVTMAGSGIAAAFDSIDTSRPN